MRFLLPLFTLVATLSAYDFALKPKRITPEVTCFFGEPEVMNTTNNGNMVNTCYIDTKKSYVVIDSGSSYAYAASAYNAMQKIKPWPVELVINTHVHDDHWLGNGFFAQKGVKVLGSDDFIHNASIDSPSRIQTHISPQAYALTVPTLPSEMIASDKTLKIGNKTLELHIMKQQAHSEKDMVVYVPQAKVLFAGDLVFNDRVPSLAGGNINGWISALELLKTYGATTIIGGHGYRTDKEAMIMTREYLIQMRSEVRSAIDEGLSIDETINKVTMPSFKSLRMMKSLHRANVETAYRTLEWEEK
ncbi:MAG: MBL fold metallo-hydrolase [Sulfuricurvum sp.]|nr:MBL fold metallo-hydrolase [Sulfuricurvum sp.]MDP3466457.1 MBL fold metallo-hydrolase [Sulfuricurvum sp.]